MRGGMPTVLASLSTKGALPNGDLVLIGGTLYGTTSAAASMVPGQYSRFRKLAARSLS